MRGEVFRLFYLGMKYFDFSSGAKDKVFRLFHLGIKYFDFSSGDEVFRFLIWAEG